MPATAVPTNRSPRPQPTSGTTPPARAGSRPASPGRTGRPWRGKPGASRRSKPASGGAGVAKVPYGEDHEILFQKFFKSVGPRTYAAQVKKARNGNHYLVLMEGKRDEATGEVRKTRLMVYSEDFVEFFRLIKSAAEFIKNHPLPAEFQAKREKFWQRQSSPAPSQVSAGASAAG